MKNGAMQSSRDDRDYNISDCMDLDENTTIPSTYMDMWMPSIRNQGETDNCTAYALSTIMSCIYHKIYNEEKAFSVGGIYGNRRIDNFIGTGRKMRDSLKTVYKYGDYTADEFECLSEVREVIDEFEKQYLKNQDTTHLIKSYVRIKKMDDAKAFLWKYKVPLFVCANMYNIIPLGGKSGHAMACYGFDNGKFYCQNSWGEKNYPNPWLEFKEFTEVWGCVPMADMKFTDVPNDRWSAEAITEAANDGIIEGFPDNTFHPSESLTREQMAVLWRRIKHYINDSINN